jgi:hypothetical protein
MIDPMTGQMQEKTVIHRVIEDYDFDQFKDLWFNVKVNAGATTQYSEIAMVQTLDNLRREGVLEIIDYLERIPDKLIPRKQELIDSIWAYSIVHGATPSPFDALNALRGIRTLSVRTTHQAASALFLAEALAEHPGVGAVHYPGLASHPQHDLAKRQMALPGGLLCFDVAGGLEGGRTFVESVELAVMASSLGGVSSVSGQ